MFILEFSQFSLNFCLDSRRQSPWRQSSLHSSMTLRNPFLMTFKNKMTIYAFTIRHSFPNLLYVTYLHDVLCLCHLHFVFVLPKGP